MQQQGMMPDVITYTALNRPCSDISALKYWTFPSENPARDNYMDSQMACSAGMRQEESAST